VIDDFETFQKVQIHPHTPNGLGVLVITIWGGVSGLDRLKPSGQNGTLRPLATELWKNPKHQIAREFYNLYNVWWNSEFQSQTKNLWPVEFERQFEGGFSHFDLISNFPLV
jgi:hypothetical protein